MGGPKAELVVDGIRLLDRAVAALAEAGCDPVYAVVRPYADAGDALPVVNLEPSRGQRSSLEAGVDAAKDADAIAVILVDTPGITADAIRTVTDAWQPGRVATGVVDGRRTHPTVMGFPLWQQAIALAEADEGARRFLAANPELVDEIEIDVDPRDLDTPADL
jgi:molybdenum cofactor cytidylyltransferase/nicotine blue oxidoreductase